MMDKQKGLLELVNQHEKPLCACARSLTEDQATALDAV